MTASVVWRRKFAGVDEIVFASDSRLSAGYKWDCAQKIFPIEGPNFCISFSGCADFAFPCIFQFQCMVRNYNKFSTGAASIYDLTKNFVDIVNQLLLIVDDRIIAQFHDTQFLLAGFDFLTGRFYGKRIVYSPEIGRFTKLPFKGIRSGNVSNPVGFSGDKRKRYLKILGRILYQEDENLNYQPLQALNELISEQDRFSSIGGSPQLIKVYRHRNFLPYAIRESAGTAISLFGRPLMDFEKTFYPILTLDSFGRDDFIHYPLSMVEQ